MWPDSDTLPKSPNRVFWIAIFLALLWHLLLMGLPWKDLFSAHRSLLPESVPIEQVDPAKLASIKRQWKERALLLNKESTPPDPNAPAPKDARYESDRNRSVEKEQISRQKTVIPTPRSGGPQSRPDTRPSKDRFTPLSRLGVPIAPASKTQPQVQGSKTPPREWGDQYVRDPSLPEGNENLLNSEQSVFYTFYARLYESIGPLWQSRIRSARPRQRLSQGEYQTAADVVFTPEGELSEVRILQSSGIPEFDEAVYYSWRKIGNFPNPPQALIKSDGLIHTGWTFNVTVDERAQLYYSNPERNY